MVVDAEQVLYGLYILVTAAILSLLFSYLGRFVEDFVYSSLY